MPCATNADTATVDNNRASPERTMEALLNSSPAWQPRFFIHKAWIAALETSAILISSSSSSSLLLLLLLFASSGFHSSVTEDSGPLVRDAALLCSYLHYFVYYYKLERDFSYFKTAQTGSGGHQAPTPPPPPKQSVQAALPPADNAAGARSSQITYTQFSIKWTRTLLLLLLLLLSSSSSSPLCRVFILIFLRQTVSLGNTVLQLFCCYYSWCLYR